SRDRGDEARRSDELVRARPVHGRGLPLRADGLDRGDRPARDQQARGRAQAGLHPGAGRPGARLRPRRLSDPGRRADARRRRLRSDRAPLPARLTGTQPGIARLPSGVFSASLFDESRSGPLFTVDSNVYAWEDVVRLAKARADWSELAGDVRAGMVALTELEARDEGPGEGDVEEAARLFRYERDLLAADELD